MTDETKPKIDIFRNALAAILIGAFVGCLPLLIFNSVPDGSKDTVTYIIGQLSGMATTCLAFYFTQKAGQDALDAKRADNTSKMADAVIAAATGTGSGTTEPTP